MSRLAEFRRGRAGDILFFAYLGAILVVAILLARAYHNQHDQTDTLKVVVQRLDAQQDRSCRAIAGGVEYWRAERETIYDTLADPDITGGQRARALARLANLNRVIAAGATITCPEEG